MRSAVWSHCFLGNKRRLYVKVEQFWCGGRVSEQTLAFSEELECLCCRSKTHMICKYTPGYNGLVLV